MARSLECIGASVRLFENPLAEEAGISTNASVILVMDLLDFCTSNWIITQSESLIFSVTLKIVVVGD